MNEASNGFARLRQAALSLVCAAGLAACAVPGPGPGSAPTSGSSSDAPRLAGSSWYWLGTLTPAGLVAPEDPGAFNLEFLDGGQLAVQLDCNAGSASWSRPLTGGLSIARLEATRKPCPRASEADRFARQLPLVRDARLAHGQLELSLGEAGTMLMARDPDGRLRNFDCPNGAPPLLVTFGRDRALVRWRGEAWSLPQQPAASGSRYGSADAILFARANEASLLQRGRQVAGPCTLTRR